MTVNPPVPKALPWPLVGPVEKVIGCKRTSGTTEGLDLWYDSAGRSYRKGSAKHLAMMWLLEGDNKMKDNEESLVICWGATTKDEDTTTKMEE